MRKVLINVVVGLFIVLVAVVIVITLSLDRIIKAGVEKVGPQVAGVEMKLDKASISLLSGKGELSGLFIGNPEGFKTESAIKAGSVRVAMRPASVFSDKIIVESINVAAPEITFEARLTGNNLSKILANIESAFGGGKSNDKAEPGAASQKKIQINNFIISDGKIQLVVTDLGSKTTTIPLPAIHLTNLGSDSQGISVADLSKLVHSAIVQGTTKAVSGALKDLGKGATEAATSAVKSATEGAEKATKGITDLFKKNK